MSQWDPREQGEYLRERFRERIMASSLLADDVHAMPEDEAAFLVDDLVTGLLIEVGAL